MSNKVPVVFFSILTYSFDIKAGEFFKSIEKYIESCNCSFKHIVSLSIAIFNLFFDEYEYIANMVGVVSLKKSTQSLAKKSFLSCRAPDIF